VKEGDRVTAGQTICDFSRARASAAVDEAEAQVRVTRQTSPKFKPERNGEIAAQQAVIARLEAQRQGNIDEQTATVARLAQCKCAVENQRYGSRIKRVSASERDSKRLYLGNCSGLQEAQAVLRRIQTTSSPEL